MEAPATWGLPSPLSTTGPSRRSLARPKPSTRLLKSAGLCLAVELAGGTAGPPSASASASASAQQSMLDGGASPGTHAHMKAEFLPELGDEVTEQIIAHGSRRAGPMAQLLIEPMGGAIGRVGEQETALGRRNVPWCYHAVALWTEPDAAAAEAQVAWARSLAECLKPHVIDGVYLNYTSDEGEDRVRASYGEEKYARLVALKDRYDPTNLFRLNQNVKPSGSVQAGKP
jgi:Berberine and berberine like